MTQNSIFSRIVEKENSYTQLLYNLMARKEQYRTTILEFLLDDLCQAQGSVISVRAQVSISNCGRPDLLVEWGSLTAIVEVKTENECRRTAKQLLLGAESEDPKRYLGYLRRKREAGGRCALVFLIPPAWRYRDKLEEEIEGLQSQGQALDIAVRVKTWRELLSCKPETKVSEGPSLWEEFQSLLEERFGVIHLSKEEVRSMVSGSMSLLSATRLTQMIKEVRLKAKKDKLPVGNLDTSSSNEISIYFQSESEKKGVSLLFGCWPVLWETEPRPLCCAVDEKYRESFEQAIREFSQAPIMGAEGWVGVGFSDEDLEAGADAIYLKLSRIWARIS